MRDLAAPGQKFQIAPRTTQRDFVRLRAQHHSDGMGWAGEHKTGARDTRRCMRLPRVSVPSVVNRVAKEKAMRIVLGAIAVSAALIATDASAQGVNLTGPYRCMQGCVAARPGDSAYVTQNG